jgi:hypothetical protein
MEVKLHHHLYAIRNANGLLALPKVTHPDRHVLNYRML